MQIHEPSVAVPQNGRAHAVDHYQPHMELARWLITYELSGAGDVQAESEAAERACRKLLDRLARLITPLGCRTLLSRALYLARVDFPFLPGVEPGVATETLASEIGKSAAGIDRAQVHIGLITLLGTLIGLVALVIGDQLMSRLLLEVWPNMPVLSGP
ncbi:MAG: hypothetical protein M3069_03445 [Chloroflexota bacterium]|nr:hypothetical protein [Chloroflexota bacterium]